MRPTDALALPGDWGTTTVSEAIEIKRGISWSKGQEHLHPRDDRVPVIRIGNVQARLELDDLLYLSGLKPAAVDKKRVAADWTIIVGSNGNRARVGNAVLIRNDDDFLFASFLIGAKPKSNSELRPEYFYRWLSSERVQAYLSASSEGTTGLNNLSHSFFRTMAIPVPPPSEQTTIARILDAVDTALEHTRAAVERARELRRCLIVELLARGLRKESRRKSEVGMIPAGWASEPLGGHIQDGPTNGVYRPEADYTLHGTRIVRIDDFADGKIHDMQALRRVVVEPVIQRRYALTKDDILVNRVNSLSHIGKAAIVPVLEEPTIFESNMMRLRCGPRLMPDFLTIVLCSDIARRHWLSRAKPAVNQASVNQRDVRELIVPLPDRTEQEEISRVVAAADGQIEMLSRVVAAHEQLKRSVMRDLLTGRVRVSNAIKAAA